MFTLLKKEFRYNLNLALPVMIGMIGHIIVGIVDNVMVGRLGVPELAAVSLGNSFLFVAMSLGIGFSTAITPLIAASSISNNYKETSKIFKNGVFLCTVLSILLFLFIIFGKSILHSLDQEEIVVELAMPYLEIVGFSLIPLVIYQGFKQFSDGLSKTKISMQATIIANIINIVMNYLLIFGHYGFPKMGIEGAAIGTLLSRIGMLAFIIIFLKRDEIAKRYFKNFFKFKIDTHQIKKIISLGFPSAMQMFFEVGLFVASIWIAGMINKQVQAANRIALDFGALTFMFAMGLSVAVMIRVGNQNGLKNYKKLKEIAISIFSLIFIIDVVFMVLFFIFHRQIPELYLNVKDPVLGLENTEVVLIAGKMLFIAAIFQLSDGLQVVFLGALRGLQDVNIPTLITFVSYFIIGLPICYYLGLYTDYKGQGIWIGLLVSLTVSSVLLFLRFKYLTEKLINS